MSTITGQTIEVDVSPSETVRSSQAGRRGVRLEQTVSVMAFGEAAF